MAEDKPQLIISWVSTTAIIPGSDVLYSGDSVRWRRGPYYQVPALAVSMYPLDEERCAQTARLVHELVEKVVVRGRFPGILNVNVPPAGDISLDNVCVVPQTVQIYHNVVAEKRDLDGSRNICLRAISTWKARRKTATWTTWSSRIAVTPLRWQQTPMAAI